MCELVTGVQTCALPISIGSRRTIMLAEDRMTKHRIYSISVASVYPHYITKAEKKGRTKAEVDEIFRWLTGYSQKALEAELAKGTSFEEFFAAAPKLNPARELITGVICGIRVETLEDPVETENRYHDNRTHDLPKGQAKERRHRGEGERK